MADSPSPPDPQTSDPVAVEEDDDAADPRGSKRRRRNCPAPLEDRFIKHHDEESLANGVGVGISGFGFSFSFGTKGAAARTPEVTPKFGSFDTGSKTTTTPLPKDLDRTTASAAGAAERGGEEVAEDGEAEDEDDELVVLVNDERKDQEPTTVDQR